MSTRDVGTKAVGEYLKVLREARGLNRTQVAAKVGTNEAQMIRIEKGEVDTRGSLLLRIAQVVDADLEDLQTLMLNPDADASTGRKLAVECLQREAAMREGFDELNLLLTRLEAEDQKTIWRELLDFAKAQLAKAPRLRPQPDPSD